MTSFHSFTVSQIYQLFCLQAVSEYEEAAAEEGYWSVCLDNQFSKFSAKMVNLYLTTFRYDEWEKFAEELQVRIKDKARFFLETKF